MGIWKALLFLEATGKSSVPITNSFQIVPPDGYPENGSSCFSSKYSVISLFLIKEKN